MKADIRLPIDAPAPPGLVHLRENHREGMAEYSFCLGVSPHHRRVLNALARVLKHERASGKAF
ncbi:MAG: hypothetical protein ACI8PT_004000 [Gammaproteobacteria bacterium]|jgi:hypothetical protein